MRLSIIIPVLNEAAHIDYLLRSLAQSKPPCTEIIVVDGGSTDHTVQLATPLADRVLTAPRGRACQLNAGAAIANGEVLLFLHADTRLPANAIAMVTDGLRSSRRCWGRFDVVIDGESAMFKVIAWMMNARSRLTGIATGDQAMFVRKEDFLAVGGFPQQPLMEDIELSKRLKRRSLPLCVHARVSTSGRRWEKFGVWRTILLMWQLRWRYWLGTPAEVLAREYR